MHEIEQNILYAVGLKIKESTNRQDYLKTLALFVNRLSDNQFDKLSQETGDWSNAALSAIKYNQNIPEFKNKENTNETN